MTRRENFCLAAVLRLLALASMLMLAAPLQAADFSLRDLNGQSHTLADYKGKWLLVNFWATWCPPCLEEIPDLIAVYDKHKEVAVIGIAMEYQNEKEIRVFADDHLISYPVVLGDEQILKQFGSADILPTTYIYNPQGKLVKVQRGLLTRQQIERLAAGK